jgi:hypothetical protein
MCRTVILPVVLYGCEILSLSLRVEHRVRVFENGMQRRIFEPKRHEVRGSKKMHNSELHNLHSTPSIIRMMKPKRMRWAGHVTCRREKRNECRILWESQNERDS